MGNSVCGWALLDRHLLIIHALDARAQTTVVAPHLRRARATATSAK
jgi:hypothetical protein